MDPINICHRTLLGLHFSPGAATVLRDQGTNVIR